jgi:hypothetical protein
MTNVIMIRHSSDHNMICGFSIETCIFFFQTKVLFDSCIVIRQIWNLQSQKRCCKQYYINSISSLNSHYLTIYALTLTRLLARRLDVSVLFRSRKISCLPWIYILEHNNLWFVLFIKNWKKNYSNKLNCTIQTQIE